jgi:trimeric autotransporter adhesin
MSHRSNHARQEHQGERITIMARSSRRSFDADRPASAADAAWFLLAGVVLDRSGNLYIADAVNRRVCKVTPVGIALTVAGPPELSVPSGLAVDSAGHLFIADRENHHILGVYPDGRLATIAGSGLAGFSGDGGRATAARLHAPWGLAVDQKDNLYIADTANHRIRKVAPDGRITTVAGVGTPGFSGDGGAATAAQLDRPIGLAVDNQGDLFIVDSLNGRVRKVDPDGVIRTVFAGSGGDRGTARTGVRYYPASIAVDREGHLLIADPFHHRIWKVDGEAIEVTPGPLSSG